MSAASAVPQEHLVQMLRDQFQNPERRIADLDKAGIDLSIISLAPAEKFYNLEGSLGIDKIPYYIAPTACISLAHGEGGKRRWKIYFLGFSRWRDNCF
jgi:hypothetical protein